MTRYLTQSLAALFERPFRLREFYQQLYFVGNQSLPIILFCVTFAAVVTILESSFHMKMVIQNDSLVPGFAAMLILRELGAVVTALLLTPRVGAGYASEVGTMQITEQVDALRMLGINPHQFLVIPRLLACIVAGVILTVFANVTCLFAAMLVSESYLGFPTSLFISSMRRFVQFQDFYFALIKGACFGAIIPLVACYFGFKCQQGAEGVGRATTKAVVASSILIIGTDFILSYLFSFFY